MKKAGKYICLVVLTAAVMLFAGTKEAGWFWPAHTVVQNVMAASKSVKLSKVLKKCKIEEIGRPEAEGLWCMRISGEKVFCLHPGKALHTNDTVSGKASDAANYKNQSLAKVTTYYFGIKKQQGGTKLYALCQAYAWAAGKGADKKKSMLQAAGYCGASESYARQVYTEISQTAPYGEVVYYTVDRCKKSSGKTHQHLIGWKNKKEQPDYASVEEPYEDTGEESIKIRLVKKDRETGKKLDGAVFYVYRDGKKVQTVTTVNGEASWTYTASYKAEVKPDKVYRYVKNWNALSRTQQEAEKKKGYYASEAAARSAWRSDMKPKADAILQAQKGKQHIWKVEEKTAPKYHHTAAAQTQTEKRETKELAYNFTDTAVSMTLHLKKKAAGAYGAEATLQGAVYGLYAAETVYGSDNSTVKYKKGEQAAELTVNEKGEAAVQELCPGLYTLKELKAPRGFVKDDELHAVDLRWHAQDMTTERTLIVEEKPIQGRVRIKKTFAGKDVPVHMVEKKQKKETYTPGLCEHHKTHTLECGFLPEVEEKSCGHIHTDSCYTVVTVCGQEETQGHTHAEDCFDEEGRLICQTEEKNPHRHSESCQEKTLQCQHVHDEACGYRKGQAGQLCTYICPVCAYESVWVEKELQITDVFALFNAKGEKISEFPIESEGEGKGTGISGYLPYGTYTLEQVRTTEHFAKVPVQTVTISQNDQLLELKLDDREEETSFYLTKLKVTDDEETGCFKKEAEEQAVFEVYGPDGQFIRKIQTDQTGTAYSGRLDAFGTGTYTVKQISGEADYELMKPQNIEILLEKKVYYAVYEDLYCGCKVRIKKEKEKAGVKTPEADAEFAVLDAVYVKETKEELAALQTAAERTSYVLELKKEHPEAVLTTLSTDENGQAAALLDMWKYETHPDGCIVLQTNGEEGYRLAAPVWSSQRKLQTEKGVHVLFFEAVDQWDDWADITLVKKMTIAEEKSIPEKGAVFALVDSRGRTVDTQTSDEDGRVWFRKAAFDRYRIEQISGDDRHELMEPISVELTEKDRHQTVEAAPAVLDKEKSITFELTKTSAETGIAVSGARYQLYRIKASDDLTVSGEEFVTDLVTGTAADPSDTGRQLPGKAVYRLPYGTYCLREVHPADGYMLDEQEYRFILDADSVSYDKNGEGTYGMSVTDEPVTGTITIEKTGNILIGYDRDSQTFQADRAGIHGAEYTLYARENISRDNGEIVYQKGEEIDRKYTDISGRVSFTRTGADGKETDRFWLGRYYVKETKAPEGYVRDETEYDVVLDWDNKTDQFDDLRELPVTEETEAPIGTAGTATRQGTYILAEGRKIHEIVKQSAQVIFTWEQAPADVKTHAASSDGTDGIVWWKEGDSCYFSTEKAGQVMYLHEDSSHMFANCRKLEKVLFKNTDTSMVTDMSYMFYRCSSLQSLDLSSFNTSCTEDMSSMFAFCPAIEKIWVNDQKLEKQLTFEQDVPASIRAVPKTAFATGHVFSADEFLFYMHYENGKSERVQVAKSEAAVFPKQAKTAGTQQVQITFGPGSRYAEFGTVQSEVMVIDPEADLIQTWHMPEVTVPLTDEDQKISIQIVKADQDDPDNMMLPGAEFTLYAACDIVNQAGEVILKKDEMIARQVSGGSTFSYVEFLNLPSAAYKKDRSSPYMYYVRETKAPEGYYGNDKTVWCTGEAAQKITAETVYGWRQEDATEAEEQFLANEEYLFKNRKIPYLVLKKEWLGDTEKTRPGVLTVSVTLPDGTVRQFVLKEANNWTQITDLDASLFARDTTEEMKARMKENLPEGYVHGRDIWDRENNTYTFVNQAELTSSRVEKIWDDGKDRDGLRPSEITVALYADDEQVKTVTLPDKNGVWAYTENNLPVADANGHVIRYMWKELPTEIINGDVENGYLSIARDAEDAKECTVIKNIHSYDAGMSVTIHKEIRKENCSFFAGPLTFTFTLSGTDTADRAQEFVQTVTFTQKDLEDVDEKGCLTKTIVFEEIPCGTYVVKESGMEGIYRNVRVVPGKNTVVDAQGVVRVQTGLKKQETENGPQKVEMTFENEAVRGKIVLTKYREDKKHMLEGVTFSLQDAQGKVLSQQTTAADGTLVFDRLLPGEYTLSEVKTVDGYTLLKEPVKITLPYTVTEEEAARKDIDVTDAVLYNGIWYFYQLPYAVTNEAGLSLPVTGYHMGLRNLAIWMMAVLCLGLGVYVTRLHRKRHTCHRHRSKEEAV